MVKWLLYKLVSDLQEERLDTLLGAGANFSRLFRFLCIELLQFRGIDSMSRIA
jgi:hypothetical protein